MGEFYVYAHYKEGKLRYIGKGKGKRAWCTSRKCQPHWTNVFKNYIPEVEIMYSGLDEQSALLFEQYYIKHAKILGAELCNDTDGGDGVSGLKPSEESRRKMSEAQKRRPPITQETRDKISKAGIGRVASEDTRKKISKAHKGKIVSAETKKKLSEAHKKPGGRKPKPPLKGRKHSEETKKKMSEAAKNMTPEHRQHLSEALKGRIITDEWRKNISEAGKRRPPISEETRKKLSEASKGRKYAPMPQERKDKIAKSVREYFRKKKEEENKLDILMEDGILRTKPTGLEAKRYDQES